MINYGELLAVVLLLLAAPLAYVNWLLGGYTASLVGCYKLWRQGACAECACPNQRACTGKHCLSLMKAVISVNKLKHHSSGAVRPPK